MASDHGARAQPIRKGRERRAEAKFELPKLRGVPYSAADCHTLGRHWELREKGFQEGSGATRRRSRRLRRDRQQTTLEVRKAPAKFQTGSATRL